MTHTSTEQPEALRMAHTLSGGKLIDDSTEWADTLHAAAADLRPHHARIEELEAQLSAIFLSCLFGSEHEPDEPPGWREFLSCLFGSELQV